MKNSRYFEFFAHEAGFSTKKLEDELFLASLLKEVAEIAISEQFPANFSVFAGFFERTLDSLLNSSRFDRKYVFLDETVAIFADFARKLEEIGNLSRFAEVLALSARNFLLLVMKWEDYLKNSWESAKVLVKY